MSAAPRVLLIDYGAGNLTSVRKGFAAVGVTLETAAVPEALDGVAGIVVPGVGHFAATAALTEWRTLIRKRIEAGAAVLGICLGMQWLFDGSDEAPEVPGLGVFSGTCQRLLVERPLKVPHVGWNTLQGVRSDGILRGVDPNAAVYFTHSYAAPVTPAACATATHNAPFAAAVQQGRVAGLQFHPEKSGSAGLQMLRNFAAMVHD